jgi:Cysteine rich repeat
MTMRSSMFALGASLLLSGSTAAISATPHTLSRYCAVDLKSLCAGITPGEGRIHACLQSHISELSVGCSARLSRAAWVAKECHADIQQFCPHAVYGSIASCMKPHLGEVSDPCKGALAFIASPASDR